MASRGLRQQDYEGSEERGRCYPELLHQLVQAAEMVEGTIRQLEELFWIIYVKGPTPVGFEALQRRPKVNRLEQWEGSGFGGGQRQ